MWVHFVYIWLYVLDCNQFTLLKREGTKVSTTVVPASEKYISLGKCFLECFDLQGCHTLTHNANQNVCKLYTSCGIDCLSESSYSTVMYTRECGSGKTTLIVWQQQQLLLAGLILLVVVEVVVVVVVVVVVEVVVVVVVVVVIVNIIFRADDVFRDSRGYRSVVKESTAYQVFPVRTRVSTSYSWFINVQRQIIYCVLDPKMEISQTK